MRGRIAYHNTGPFIPVILLLFLLFVALGIGGYLDFEFWARERAKPSQHSLGPPLERPLPRERTEFSVQRPLNPSLP